MLTAHDLNSPPRRTITTETYPENAFAHGVLGAKGRKPASSILPGRDPKPRAGDRPLAEISDSFINPEAIAWEIKTWRAIVPMSASQFYVLRKRGLIETIKIGTRTLVITAPKEFIARFTNNGGAK